MPRLGILLVRAGACTEESVSRALAVQGFAGGRIGTLLIERGSVSEDDVGNALAEQHGCQYIPWKTLSTLPTTVTAALPAKFAIRHSAVPVEQGEGFLRVALRDPSNLRILDELFFVTGKKIVPAVAPEVRLYQALEKYYGERRTPRFAILAEKLSRPTAPSVIRKPLPPPPDFSADTLFLPGEPRPSEPEGEERSLLSSWKIPDEPPVGWGGLPPPPEEVDLETESIAWEEIPSGPPRSGRREEPRGGAAPPPAPRAPAWRETAAGAAATRSSGMPEAVDFKGILAASGGGRDAVFDAALSALARRFRRYAVFVARPEGVAGWSGAGPGVDREALKRFEIPWSEPSIFLNVRLSRSFYLGPLPPLPRHDELSRSLGGAPAECVVQPVLMREKTVAFFLADCSGPAGATPADLTYARELAGATAAALAASIRLKKKQVI
jgi:Type II secretion system (T2SS), protein E, N-terminal domain